MMVEAPVELLTAAEPELMYCRVVVEILFPTEKWRQCIEDVHRVLSPDNIGGLGGNYVAHRIVEFEQLTEDGCENELAHQVWR